jgi:hypothetical protein
MRRALVVGMATLTVVAALGCGPRVMVPPRIDLTEHEVLGIIEFATSEEGELGAYATRRFVEASRRDQGMVRIAELGPEVEVLEDVGHDRLDPAAFKDIGERYAVTTIFTGDLEVSDVRPDFTITPGFDFVSVSAEVDVTLDVRMVETATGASIWSSSASATESVGHVSLFGDDISFDAEDPDKAYGKLVEALVEEVTRDFRVSWKRN